MYLGPGRCVVVSQHDTERQTVSWHSRSLLLLLLSAEEGEVVVVSPPSKRHFKDRVPVRRKRSPNCPIAGRGYPRKSTRDSNIAACYKRVSPFMCVWSLRLATDRCFFFAALNPAAKVSNLEKGFYVCLALRLRSSYLFLFFQSHFISPLLPRTGLLGLGPILNFFLSRSLEVSLTLHRHSKSIYLSAIKRECLMAHTLLYDHACT